MATSRNKKWYGNPILVVAVFIVIIIVSIFAYHFFTASPAPPPTPLSSPPPPPSTTTISSISADPYISASQATAFIGTVTFSAIKSYNTPAELAALTHNYDGIATNETEAWTVMYGGPNNANLTEFVSLMVSAAHAQSLYMSMVSQGSSNNNLVYGSQNGMNYSASSNQTRHISGVIGWKGPYIAIAVMTNATANASMTKLIAVTSADLP